MEKNQDKKEVDCVSRSNNRTIGFRILFVSYFVRREILERRHREIALPFNKYFIFNGKMTETQMTRMHRSFIQIEN